MSLHQLNSKDNGLHVGLLIKTISRHRNCFLSSVATDSKDGDGLKFAQFFSSFDAMSLQITKNIVMVSSR